MRKLIDFIADKFGYQRKFRSIPIQWPPMHQELIDDGIVWDWLWENAKKEMNSRSGVFQGVYLEPTGSHETDPFIKRE